MMVSTVSKGWIELWKLPRSRPANPAPFGAIARTSKRASDPGNVLAQPLRALTRRRTPEVTVNRLSRLTERVRQPEISFARASFSDLGLGGSAVGGGAAGAGVRAMSANGAGFAGRERGSFQTSIQPFETVETVLVVPCDPDRAYRFEVELKEAKSTS